MAPKHSLGRLAKIAITLIEGLRRVSECDRLAQNTLWNIGRAVGALGPIMVGALAAKYSFHAAIALLASVYFLDTFATLFLIPELRGKPLD